jgi:hypothetical protein
MVTNSIHVSLQNTSHRALREITDIPYYVKRFKTYWR